MSQQIIVNEMYARINSIKIVKINEDDPNGESESRDVFKKKSDGNSRGKVITLVPSEILGQAVECRDKERVYDDEEGGPDVALPLFIEKQIKEKHLLEVQVLDTEDAIIDDVTSFGSVQCERGESLYDGEKMITFTFTGYSDWGIYNGKLRVFGK